MKSDEAGLRSVGDGGKLGDIRPDARSERTLALAAPSDAEFDRVLSLGLAEDSPWGDVTSELLLPERSVANAAFVAREPGVLAGGRIAARAMALVDPAIEVEVLVADGAALDAGTVVATVAGPARGVLRAERVALNLLQRLSGIATETARYVSAVAGTRARIVDTRKTTPGLRVLEKYAVRCGGGHNHRFSLSDAVLAKDNHLGVIAAHAGLDLAEVLREARSRLPHTMRIEVEVDRIEQLDAVLDGGADIVLLDNFTLPQLREAVAIIGDRAIVEASGGVTLQTVAEIAATGVDLVSVGALTHSVRALDLGLDLTLDLALDLARDVAPDVAPEVALDPGRDLGRDTSPIPKP